MKPRRYFIPRRFARRHAIHFGVVCTLATTIVVRGGDLLRGGAATNALPPGATATTNTPAPITASAAGSPSDTLAKTTQAIQAVQAMQTAARNLAKNNGSNNLGQNPNNPSQLLPDVPDGLAAGGLEVDPRVPTDSTLWQGANLPVQSTTSGGTVQVTVKQTAQQALLNWKTFNVGKNTKLTFDQSDGGSNVGQWIAFNKVNDPTANPTQILGTIEAPGQVYIINRNGIIFGGSSQVNTHALVASTLPINATLVQNGLLNNPDHQFLFDGLDKGASDDIEATTKFGDVIVQAGATITAPSSAAHVGGRVMLVGPNVTNNGTISTPDGQTILAAGLQVGIVAHDSSDPSLRGIDVVIGAVVDPASSLAAYAGTSTNTGLIDSARASITMAGKTVNQMGAIASTTSVSFNGRIDLLASYDAVANLVYDPTNSSFGPAFLNKSTGNVTLGEDSVTRIRPEYESTDKVVGSVLALPSQVNITGNQVHFDNGATLVAPGANVTVNAGKWLTIPAASSTGTTIYSFVRADGRIDLDPGAVIDVSGSRDVASSVTSNIVEVQLRGNELADSPLLRDGALRGATLYVDISQTGTYNGKTWVGTPLADVSGYVNLVQRTVGELTVAGGTVKLNAGEAVVIRDGATVDVSGGWVNYAGGIVNTSRVVAGGKIFDVSKATPDRVYDGVYLGGNTVTHSKWGVTEQYTNPLAADGSRYQEGFTQGGGGGTLNIAASSIVLDGGLKGSTFTGPQQRLVAPRASVLNLSWTAEHIVGNTAYTFSPAAPTITFSDSLQQAKVGDYEVNGSGVPVALPSDRVEDVVLSSSILGAEGFGSLAITNPDGDIKVESGVALMAAPKGSISFSGANIEIDGALVAPGGSLSLTAYNLSPSEIELLRLNGGWAVPAAEADRGHFSLGSGAVLSTAGLITDERNPVPTATGTPVVNTGGTITVQSFSADLATGSLIDVSGGVQVGATGKVTYGNGGAITLATGRDVTLPSVAGGGLTLGSTLKGYSGAKGGSLSIQAMGIQVGGTASAGTGLLLDASFFDQGGFSSFSLAGIGRATGTFEDPVPGLVIAGGTVIKPTVTSWVASGIGTDGPVTLTSYVKPEGLSSPLSLSFSAVGYVDDASQVPLVRGDLVMEAGSSVDAGALGSVTLKGDTVEVHGSVKAAGGTIQVSGAGKLPVLTDPLAPGTTVWLASDARLDASGATLLIPDSFGRRRGAVLAGGKITVSGNLVADQGAVVDVSGASGTLDLLPGESGGSLSDLASGVSGTTSKPYNTRGKSTVVASSGGTITLSGGQMLLTDATLKGQAGGATAAGGTLQVSSGRFYPTGTLSSPFDPTLSVVNDGSVIPGTMGHGIGVQMVADGSGLSGGGRFAASSFEQGGFSNLDLGGVVKFSGAVDIHAKGRITAGTGPALYADSTVTLDASRVVLGVTNQLPLTPTEEASFRFLNSQGQEVFLAPSHGAGELTVFADLIDAGYLSLQGIGKADLIADGGDIRGNGTLEIAGDLGLKAARIYPPTALKFTIAAFDYQVGSTLHKGSVTIEKSGTKGLPLSAGGSLSVYASTIHQSGNLLAPFGTIQLGWDGSGTAPTDVLSGGTFAKTDSLVLGAGSLTSVSGIDPITGKGVIIPYGVSLDGTTWLDPRGVDITSTGVPQKSIKLAGASVTTEEGSKIDTRGGGDLLAYRWVQGLGGSTDILASTGSFAVIPGYDSSFAPYAPFGQNSSLSGNAGYVNSTLQVGDQVHLNGGGGLPAGTYTLLPARYALLPGAFLVTPQSAAAIGTVPMADGSALVSGARFNGLQEGLEMPVIETRFEVASAQTVSKRAEYTKLLANTFLTTTGGLRLPGDSGQLVLAATQTMAIAGQVASAASGNFRGGLIDISSPLDIVISGGGTTAAPGSLVLDSTLLSGFGAESLLIGGYRETTSEGTKVTVTTTNLTLDNAGSPLTGSEIILASKNELNVEDGASVQQSGKVPAGDTLIFGDAAVTGSGNGALLRLGGANASSIIRRGVVVGTGTTLDVGANVVLKGNGLALDSTSKTLLASNATLEAKSLSLSSGHVSLLLDPAITPGPDAGLVLAGSTLASLSSAGSFALASYSSLDLLGAGSVGEVGVGGRPVIDTLVLRASEIRGLQNGGGEVDFHAKTISIDNLPGGTASAASLSSAGKLAFHGDSILLGTGATVVKGFTDVELDATKGGQTTATGGFHVTGNLKIDAPVVYAANSVVYGIKADGSLTVANSGGAGTVSGAGLGSSLTLEGSSVAIGSRIVLPSGEVKVHATGAGGDVSVTGSIDAGGLSRRFKDVVKYTSGGRISLVSDAGNVILATGGNLEVGAQAGGGDAGSLVVSAAHGTASLLGGVSGVAAKGAGGSFSLDTGSLPTLAVLADKLNAAGFNNTRSIRVRTGDVLVDGISTAGHFDLSADVGALLVTGTIDASGKTGGSIALSASRGVTLASGSLLDVSGVGFDSAGKGGSVSLETRGANGGTIAIQAGSVIDLGVDAKTATSASLGKFTGTLHLRAPQNAGATDLAVGAIDGEIRNASSILVEGYKIYDLTGSGVISTTVKNQVMANGIAFTANSAAIESRLLLHNASLGAALTVRPGAEIVNSTGDLTLGTATSQASAGDWNLSTFRFGPDLVPGVLTLRAAGDLVFYNSLSDGFTASTYLSALQARNGALPMNSQSWSYRLVAGADLSAVDYDRVLPMESLASGKGSLLLGKNAYNASVSSGSGTTSTAVTSAALNSTASNPGWFQVIRTGSGDIDIATGRDIRLLNPFASIYTAGTLVEDATLGGTFVVPKPSLFGPTNAPGTLGAVQQTTASAVQYTVGGGNVNLYAGNDIIHLTLNTQGQLIQDSQRQMPNNWLYRRGYVDAAGNSVTTHYGEDGSTTWWVDFTNFFEGIGALGGGNVTLVAGRDVSNVDAVAPTNARMPKGLADEAKLVELGGGDVTVKAGRNIDGGVYYVERGHGTLSAGDDIMTNWTRSPSLTTLKTPADILDSATWLPTTLFLGKGTFDVAAGGDVLLGPVANTFLLPQGFNNSFWYKTYFSTYGEDSGVSVESLGGDITIRAGVSLPDTNTASPVVPTLQAWYDRVLRLGPRLAPTASTNQPWLLLAESSVTPFSKAFGLMPGTLHAASFSGDINIVGNLTLSPSKTGTVEMLAGGSISGLQIAGSTTFGSQSVHVWASGQINLSDADPSLIYNVVHPFAYQSVSGNVLAKARTTENNFLSSFDALFTETGSTNGGLQQKQALHMKGLLHEGDTEPVRIYAEEGDISGFTLYSAKSARILAGEDIRDISFYLQNVSASDVSVVAAGRDIVAYDMGTADRIQSISNGNAITSDLSPAGDIQISGPGTLEVLAGRNLDLGIGANNANGTGTGITSIGNGRNPNLPFDGASIIAAAGIGDAMSLDTSHADFASFITKFVEAGDGPAHLKELGVTSAEFGAMDSESQRQVALQVFFLVLRDAGRNHNKADSAGFGNYDAGKEAIATLFPGNDWAGDINTRSRDIRTRSGGDITLLAPGGSLSLATTVIGSPLAPPGIITEAGGNISVFTNLNVDLGISRIFTLRGGDEIIWSTKGNIAAGSSSKTVQSAPPTRVLIDPQSADVKTDLAGLATGGGIGVLSTVQGVAPSDVDLIAPEGTIDAGDAGIRVSGNLNIAAAVVVNAGNISVGGSSSGAQSVSVSGPGLGSLTSASNTSAATTAAATEPGARQNDAPVAAETMPSIIVVEVIGYGGSDESDSEPGSGDPEKDKKPADAVDAPAP
ncbi:filamentous haemagglutinin family protein [Luteolibacter sp. LG18]|uniref:filamentous haemagglutinin family protein n=1 Tax=Luteolibacter sp. LG18 TaxID=2819286 RepID=UPI002B284F15|nr:hypothetical protein llg_00250 [Luteolibacter sp. LG18]